MDTTLTHEATRPRHHPHEWPWDLNRTSTMPQPVITAHPDV